MKKIDEATLAAFNSMTFGPTIAELVAAGKLEKPGDRPAEIGWFPVASKPERVGVYRTRTKGIGVGFSYFDGFRWGNQSGDPKRAEEWFELYGASGVQDKEWCGLAEAAH